MNYWAKSMFHIQPCTVAWCRHCILPRSVGDLYLFIYFCKTGIRQKILVLDNHKGRFLLKPGNRLWLAIISGRVCFVGHYFNGKHRYEEAPHFPVYSFRLSAHRAAFISILLIVSAIRWQSSGLMSLCSLRGWEWKVFSSSCHLLTAWTASSSPIALSDAINCAQPSDEELGFAFLGLSGGGNRWYN